MAEPGARTIGMMANANWCASPLPLRLAVLAFSRRQTIEDEGRRVRLGWLWGMPFLLGVSRSR